MPNCATHQKHAALRRGKIFRKGSRVVDKPNIDLNNYKFDEIMSQRELKRINNKYHYNIANVMLSTMTLIILRITVMELTEIEDRGQPLTKTKKQKVEKNQKTKLIVILIKLLKILHGERKKQKKVNVECDKDD